MPATIIGQKIHINKRVSLGEGREGYKFLNIYPDMEKEIKLKCERCGLDNLRLERWVFGNKKNRWRKNIKVICLKCSHHRAVKITKQMQEITKKLRWRHKKKLALEKDGFDFLII